MTPPVCRILRSRGELEAALREVEPYPASLPIMMAKGKFLTIQLVNLDPRAANILKQEMLARGGEAAISWEVLALHGKPSDVLLLGTTAQLQSLCAKMKLQPFGLHDWAGKLEQLLVHHGSSPAPTTLRARNFAWGERTFLMGIINLTPDSFSGDGMAGRVDQALKKAQRMVEQGADLIDVGGESTRPGHDPVDIATEWGRVADFLREFLPHSPLPVSLDTWKEEIARRGLELGVDLINDVWGLRRSRGIARLVAQHKAGLILQHNRQHAEYRHFLPEVVADLEESMSWAFEDGVSPECVIVDPGFGFGKTPEQNFWLLRELRALRGLGQPLLAGVSHKSFIGLATGKLPAERLLGTAAAIALAIEGGADLVRVHEVAEMREVVQVCDRALRC
jgi:dihydropteroate synthase